MNLPESVAIRLIDGLGKPVAHSFARVRIAMPRKNDFYVWVGPSDSEGHIRASAAALLVEARREMHSFVMDHIDPSEATGEISVHACSPMDVDKAIAAYKEFGPHLEYPPAWSENLAAARSALAKATEPITAVAQSAV